ncbi:hypothetical protein ACRALDRAFT_2016065 [Sodiomyces alcalophilus JCM 7366]|uniref:uncharacterized protein n=1 Tax=Sodiomyces alcalophilus JCM 7366 TaxID=591952 RepID=UPI0039B5353A
MGPPEGPWAYLRVRGSTWGPGGLGRTLEDSGSPWGTREDPGRLRKSLPWGT